MSEHRNVPSHSLAEAWHSAFPAPVGHARGARKSAQATASSSNKSRLARIASVTTASMAALSLALIAKDSVLGIGIIERVAAADWFRGALDLASSDVLLVGSATLLGTALACRLARRHDVANTTTLGSALAEWRTRAFRECYSHGIGLHWNVTEDCRRVRLQSSQLLHLSGVLQELIAGSIHRGRSCNLWIRFACARNKVTLVVEDDGAWQSQERQHDAHNIEYRAAEAAGEIRCDRLGIAGRKMTAVFSSK